MSPFSGALELRLSAMSRLYIFADESGDFHFRTGENISRYFIVCTVTMKSCNVGGALLNLRRKLAWHDYELGDHFHATTDKQAVRDLVFEAIAMHDLSIQATIMEKAKAQPQTRTSDSCFYKYGWFYHFHHGMPSVARPYSEIHVTAASIGFRRERSLFKGAVSDVMNQTIRGKKWSADVFPAATDPCLQVADYCAWAVQRKWERDDSRSYDIIKDKISYEYDLWAHGNKRYY